MAKKPTTPVKKVSTPVKTEKSGDEPDLSFIPLWSKKLNKKAEELTKELEKIVEELRKKHGNKWTEDKLWGTARRRLYNGLKSEFRSSATVWLVCPCYMTESNDYGNKAYQTALDKYAKNPQEAIKQGYVTVKKDSKGKTTEVIPLDIKKKTNAGKDNKNYGKAIPEHNYIQTIGGLAVPYSDVEKDNYDRMRVMDMTNSRIFADPTSEKYLGKGFKLGKWYKIKLSNATPQDEEEFYKLNGTSVSKWVHEEGTEDLDVSQIESYFEGFYCPLGELTEYHDGYAEENDKHTKRNSNRLVVTEGDVISVDLSEDGNSSHRIAIDDESLGLADEDGNIVDSVMIWVNPTTEINFGKDSHIIVFGKTSQGKAKDLATGEVTEEWGNVSISAMNIIVTELVEPEVEEGDNEEDESVEADEDGEEISEDDVDLDADDTVEETDEEGEEGEEEGEEGEEEDELPPMPTAKKSTAKKPEAPPKSTAKKSTVKKVAKTEEVPDSNQLTGEKATEETGNYPNGQW